jgi:hypothetical protein
LFKSIFVIASVALLASSFTPAQAALNDNGLRPNGGSENGLRPNGLRPNGGGENGLRPNGLRPNGGGENGLRPNGLRPNGTGENGAEYGMSRFEIDGIELPTSTR